MRLFGKMPDGRDVYEAELKCGKLSCSIIEFGASIKDFVVPDRNGEPVDISLGFDDMDGYIAQNWHCGSVLGRFCNRIAGASFDLNGKHYELAANDGPNHIHGGPGGFDRVLWSFGEVTENTAVLSYNSPDMEEGYPGNLTITVKYTLDDEGLELEYSAVCDRDTLWNATNHAYFNVSGHASGDILDQIIRINADFYTPCLPGSILSGEIAPVEGTPMDLRVPVAIGEHIEDDFEQLILGAGYDHNWVINGEMGDMRCAAEVYSGSTGIKLSVYTDRPAMQFYAGNYMGDGCKGKYGAWYVKRDGLCLETQLFPDSPHHPEWPSAVLKAGCRKSTVTKFCVSAE